MGHKKSVFGKISGKKIELGLDISFTKKLALANNANGFLKQRPLADLSGEGALRTRTLVSGQLLSFSCSFRQNLPNNRLAQILNPPLGAFHQIVAPAKLAMKLVSNDILV